MDKSILQYISEFQRPFFVQFNGSSDNYEYELYELKENLSDSIVIEQFEKPTADELEQIHRGEPKTIKQFVASMVLNFDRDIEKSKFQSLITELFLHKNNLNICQNAAITLLVYFNRYKKYNCIIKFGPCKKDNEALFLKFCTRIGKNVIEFCPDLNDKSVIDEFKTISYSKSSNIKNFPKKPVASTICYSAEQEIRQVLSQETDLSHAYSIKRIKPLVIKTTFDEIRILYDQELKFRPYYKKENGMITAPVLLSKIIGVSDDYDNVINSCIVDNSVLISNEQIHHVICDTRKDISLLRKEIQDVSVSAIETLKESSLKNCANVFEFMSKELFEKMQKFDFDGKNPKLVLLLNKEDALPDKVYAMIEFCHLVGFDILAFVPTGYRLLEKKLSHLNFVEHVIGEINFDISVNINDKTNKKSNIFDVFRRMKNGSKL